MPEKHIGHGSYLIDQLERELHLKQLQINRLLNITQAINDNVKAQGLFEMYTSFLSWEMGVKKMALYFRQADKWVCTASIGIEKEMLPGDDLASALLKYTRPHSLAEAEHPFLREFEVVIPVRHKNEPLAFVLLGGFSENEDLYGKVQFITTITNIIAVAIENKRLFKRQLEQELLRKEMELAREMQRLLIPSDLPSTPQYELAGIYQPHLNVGGDYYDFIQAEDGGLIFCIADIAGKGMAAALLMSNLQANVHSLLKQHSALPDFITALNAAMMRITKGERFFTFFIGRYDPQTRLLRYVNAGHPPPVLVMEGQVHRLSHGTTVLGALDELPMLEEGLIKVEGSSLLLMATDGLSELRNDKGEFLDVEEGKRFILSHAHLSAAQFNEYLMRALDRFRGKTPFQDDFTVLTVRLH